MEIATRLELIADDTGVIGPLSKDMFRNDIIEMEQAINILRGVDNIPREIP